MTILEDLWYGNVRPTERSIQRGGKLDNLMKLLCQNEDDLMSGLSEKQKESFNKFKDCQSEITDCLETEAFAFLISVVNKHNIFSLTDCKFLFDSLRAM